MLLKLYSLNSFGVLFPFPFCCVCFNSGFSALLFLWSLYPFCGTCPPRLAENGCDIYSAISILYCISGCCIHSAVTFLLCLFRRSLYPFCGICSVLLPGCFVTCMVSTLWCLLKLPQYLTDYNSQY
jgi:hypothetical protein